MAMQVTGQLREPMLEPCPGGSDLSTLKDDQCRPVKCTRQPDWTGTDCCQFWKASPNVWSNDVVRVDQLNPEQFKYDQYRYQVFAKPNNISRDHHNGAASIPDKQYVAPTTDVRALRQTMYIPVVPHNPGGVNDFSFPMTPQTMNEPDVTTASCVPVVPCNPGFQNMTASVRPDPNYMCQTYNKCKQPMQIGPRRVNISSEIARTQVAPKYQPDPASAPQFGAPATYPPGGTCHGTPDVFSDPHQSYAVPYPPGLAPPQFADTMSGGQDCAALDPYTLGLDVVYDGVNSQHGKGTALTNVKSIRYKDRVDRAIRSNAETQNQRVRRLKSMYGAFGSYLVSNPYTRRHLEGVRDTIHLQGNGFAWSHPKHHNQQCYVVERNPRC